MTTQAPTTQEDVRRATAVLPPTAGFGPRRRSARQALSAAFVLLACILWFLSLAKLGASTEALPWYLTIGAIAAICARQAARRPSLVLTFDWLPRPSREPLTLLESWTIAYCVAATSLYLWIVLQPPPSKEEARKLVQFVDIQLTSATDAADRNSLLPGTVEADKLRKRDSDKLTQQGSLSSTKVAQVARKQVQQVLQKETKQIGETAVASTRNQPDGHDTQQKEKPHASQPRTMAAVKQPVAIAAAHAVNADGVRTPLKPLDNQKYVVKPAAQGSPTVRAQSSSTRNAASQQPLIEEVQAPEMVEFIENDGVRDATTVFASGGSSAGGTGAPNDLNVFIQGLHKRIKQAWSPPRGQSRRAQVLFRIRRDGTLSFIKIIHSSGDSDTDSAAIQTVQHAVNGKPLPADYPLPYLDVQYNFLYTADELKEVKTQM